MTRYVTVYRLPVNSNEKNKRQKKEKTTWQSDTYYLT